MASAGGGGGSSFVVAGATDVSSGVSTRTGDGQVIISYDPATDSCPPPRFALPDGFPTNITTRTAGGAAIAATPILVVPRFTG